jgi:hypothetical protein
MSTDNVSAATSGDNSKDTIFVNDYFGGCPECGDANYLNVGKTHFICCEEHKMRDCIGENLFSSWKDETEEVWDRNRRLLEGYTDVEFLPEGMWSKDPAKRKLEMEEFDRKRKEAAEKQRSLDAAAFHIVRMLDERYGQDELRVVSDILHRRFDAEIEIPF